MLVYTSERQIFMALYFGIGNGDLDPTTVEWAEESKFTASSVFGQKIYGEIIEAAAGLPTVLEWYFGNAEDRQFRFILEYKYGADRPLSYYPSSIQYSIRLKGQKQNTATCTIALLKTTVKPLEESLFDPQRYFAKGIAPHVREVIISNNESYYMNGGQLQKVLPLSALPPPELGGVSKSSSASLRWILLIFCVVSLVGIFNFWKHTNTNERKDR